MPRDKARDDKYFNCNQESERNYVSGLYHDKKSVYDFLVKSYYNNLINYSTHNEIYQLIQYNLGYPIPL
jgi:hypothetical protein